MFSIFTVVFNISTTYNQIREFGKFEIYYKVQHCLTKLNKMFYCLDAKVTFCNQLCLLCLLTMSYCIR